MRKNKNHTIHSNMDDTYQIIPHPMFLLLPLPDLSMEFLEPECQTLYSLTNAVFQVFNGSLEASDCIPCLQANSPKWRNRNGEWLWADIYVYSHCLHW